MSVIAHTAIYGIPYMKARTGPLLSHAAPYPVQQVPYIQTSSLLGACSYVQHRSAPADNGCERGSVCSGGGDLSVFFFTPSAGLN